MSGNLKNKRILYEPQETPPTAIAVGLGFQYALLSLSGMIIIPLIIFRAAQAPEAMLTWAVFASLIICGLITLLHAYRLGRVGAGYVLVTGTTSAAIAVSVDAIVTGGVALLASLMLASSLFQFLIASRLSLFRRLFTPTVSGVVLMLIPVTIMPVVFAMLEDSSDASSALAAPLSALVTLVVIGGVMVKGSQRLRAWAPLIGLMSGAATAAAFGEYDTGRVAAANWIGIPQHWPGLDFDFGPSFLQLLPAFLLVFLVCTVRTMSGSMAIQHVSWRSRRGLDFRSTQGAVAADALSNLLSCLACTVPNGVRATTVALTELTGVAARRVGLFFGLMLAGLAFLPKIIALVLAVPGPVAAGYMTVMISLVFVLGIRMIVSVGLNRIQVLVVGVSFWFGVGCQYGFIFPEHIPNIAGGLLKSGLTAGGLAAIILTGLNELATPRQKKLETRLELAALSDIQIFVRNFAARIGWDKAMTDRLVAVSEETLLTLLREHEEAETQERRLLIGAHREGTDALLEFTAASGEENLEDRLALLGEGVTEGSIERDVSLRLLRHLAAEVRHRQYYDADFITVRVASKLET